MATKLASVTKEWLEREYIVRNRRLKDVAAELRCSPETLNRLRREYGLSKSTNGPRHVLTEELLQRMYVDQQMSASEIADELGGMTKGAVLNALRRHNIPVRVKTCSKGVAAYAAVRRKPGCGAIPWWYWRTVLKSAAARKIDFNITLEHAHQLWELQNGRCAFTGMPLRFGVSRYHVLTGKDTQTASLDRIDSEAGYVSGNVQWIHKQLQRMKHDLSDADFIYWCGRVANHKRAAA